MQAHSLRCVYHIIRARRVTASQNDVAKVVHCGPNEGSFGVFVLARGTTGLAFHGSTTACKPHSSNSTARCTLICSALRAARRSHIQTSTTPPDSSESPNPSPGLNNPAPLCHITCSTCPLQSHRDLGALSTPWHGRVSDLTNTCADAKMRKSSSWDWLMCD